MPDLAKVFAVLGPDQRVTPVPVTPTIYEQLDHDFDRFRGHVLVSTHAFDRDWPTWEIHPAGDEIVILTAGEAKFLLDVPGGAQTVTLSRPGEYVIVPRDTWHTAKIASSATLVFITPGEGTRNEERP